jgi:hypothetical protein
MMRLTMPLANSVAASRRANTELFPDARVDLSSDGNQICANMAKAGYIIQ